MNCGLTLGEVLFGAARKGGGDTLARQLTRLLNRTVIGHADRQLLADAQFQSLRHGNSTLGH